MLLSVSLMHFEETKTNPRRCFLQKGRTLKKIVAGKSSEKIRRLSEHTGTANAARMIVVSIVGGVGVLERNGDMPVFITHCGDMMN